MSKKSRFEELRDDTRVRTSTDLVKHIENTLGWCQPWDDLRPAWKVRSIEAGKINRAIKRNPKLYTMENLLLAVEYLRIRKQPVKSPIGVIYTVEKAIKEMPKPEKVTDLAAARERALERVRDRYPLNHPERGRWIRRLQNSKGQVFLDALEELDEVAP